jgi:membrane protease YdiL (CAAX protease family)
VDSSDPTSRPGPALEPVPRPVRGHPLALFVAMLLVYVGPGAVAQLSSRAAGLAWTQLFAFLLPAAAFATASNLVPARVLRIDRPPPRGTIAVALAIGAAGFLAAGALMALVSAALPRSWVQMFDVMPLFQGPKGERIALSLVAAIVAPFCEEVAFRGHLLSVLGARLRPGAAIGASALLFAVMHLDPVRFVAVLALGLLFGWLTWRAGSLWPAVAAHCANNAVATLLVTSTVTQNLGAEADRPQPVASLLMLLLGIALVTPMIALYQRLTPAPAPLELALVAADPTDHDPHLRLRRVPGWMLVVAVIGVAFVALLATLHRIGVQGL